MPPINVPRYQRVACPRRRQTTWIQQETRLSWSLRKQTNHHELPKLLLVRQLQTSIVCRTRTLSRFVSYFDKSSLEMRFRFLMVLPAVSSNEQVTRATVNRLTARKAGKHLGKARNTPLPPAKTFSRNQFSNFQFLLWLVLDCLPVPRLVAETKVSEMQKNTKFREPIPVSCFPEDPRHPAQAAVFTPEVYHRFA